MGVRAPGFRAEAPPGGLAQEGLCRAQVLMARHHLDLQTQALDTLRLKWTGAHLGRSRHCPTRGADASPCGGNRSSTTPGQCESKALRGGREVAAGPHVLEGRPRGHHEVSRDDRRRPWRPPRRGTWAPEGGAWTGLSFRRYASGAQRACPEWSACMVGGMRPPKMPRGP